MAIPDSAGRSPRWSVCDVVEGRGSGPDTVFVDGFPAACPPSPARPLAARNYPISRPSWHGTGSHRPPKPRNPFGRRRAQGQIPRSLGMIGRTGPWHGPRILSSSHFGGRSSLPLDNTLTRASSLPACWSAPWCRDCLVAAQVVCDPGDAVPRDGDEILARRHDIQIITKQGLGRPVLETSDVVKTRGDLAPRSATPRRRCRVCFLVLACKYAVSLPSALPLSRRHS